MATERPLNAEQRSMLEQIVRGLCLGILAVTFALVATILLDRRGLGGSPTGLIAGSLMLLLMGWMWLYRWGREGLRWQFGCGYVGFVTIAFNVFAQAFLGGASGPLWLIGFAGVAYGLVPMIKRPQDAELERLAPGAPSPYAAEPHTGVLALEMRMQAQVLAFVILGGWTILVWTRMNEFAAFLGRREGILLAAYLWMIIGGFWWFSIGRRGVTAKSMVASVCSALMAANLYFAAFFGEGSWVITLVGLLVNLVALVQWLPNRGMEALPNSPQVGEWPKPFDTADAHAGHAHH